MTTPYQRAEIIRLLRKLEFDSVTLTFQHRTLGAPDYLIGKSVEGWIDTMGVDQASALINRLRKDALIVEDEE